MQLLVRCATRGAFRIHTLPFFMSPLYAAFAVAGCICDLHFDVDFCVCVRMRILHFAFASMCCTCISHLRVAVAFCFCVCVLHLHFAFACCICILLLRLRVALAFRICVLHLHFAFAFACCVLHLHFALHVTLVSRVCVCLSFLLNIYSTARKRHTPQTSTLSSFFIGKKSLARGVS